MGVQGSSHCHVNQMCRDGKGISQSLYFRKLFHKFYSSQEKCAWYWPNELHDRYSGDKFTVTLTSITPHVEYGMRCFEVQSVSNLTKIVV